MMAFSVSSESGIELVLGLHAVEVGFVSLIIGSDGSTTCPVEAFIAILTVRIIDFGILHGWIAPGIEELEERARVALGESSSV
jgi:hypothetical protein